VEGYAEARAEVEDVRRRRRRELAALLVGEPAAPEGDVRAAAKSAGWPLPRRVAPLCCAELDLPALARRLPPETLATILDGVGCLLIPDPDGPGRGDEIERAARGRGAALGPAGPLSELAASWSLAGFAMRAAEAGTLPAEGLLRVEDRLGDLLILIAGPLVRRLASRRLSPLESLTDKAAARMSETALAYVRHGGNSVAMARELHVHPQTARYRMARLRELLGEQLDDPDARFELEAALRGLALSAAGSSAGS
jgi:hypothetical protein